MCFCVCARACLGVTGLFLEKCLRFTFFQFGVHLDPENLDPLTICINSLMLGVGMGWRMMPINLDFA